MQSLDVGAWLEELGLGQYRALFSDQAIDSDVLPDLTDDDLVFAEGKEDELLGRLQKKLGKSKDEVRHMIEGL